MSTLVVMAHYDADQVLRAHTRRTIETFAAGADRVVVVSTSGIDEESHAQLPVNVEFVTPLRDGGLTMRVHERGVGETRSCGTGTVAAAVAALRAAGRVTGSVAVGTPGGRLRVDVSDDTTVLTGPAVLVASGELDPCWWKALG